jgi:hypothetical protein
MNDIITCPTGLSGRIRPLKVREERVLANRRLAKQKSQMDELLTACWVETIASEPYDFGDKKIDWGKILQGDRFYTLLKIRQLTYGSTYAFTTSCQHTACRERIDWEVDLDDLPVRPLAEESRLAFQDGNRFETMLPAEDRRVWFRLLTGDDEKKFARLRKRAGDNLLSAMLNYRILEIQGVEPQDKRRFIEDLSMADADFLVDEFDRVDFGVDTTIEIECPDCFALQEVELPFDRRFFMPGKERTKRRRARSTSSRG